MIANPSIEAAPSAGDRLGVGDAAVVAVESALYSYRLTKPSAAAVVEWKELALLGNKANTAGLRAATRRAQAVAAGVNLARDCANRPDRKSVV